MLATLLLLLAGPVLAAEKAMEFTESELKAIYFSDLGPAEIDVARYPDEQKKNYAVFQRKCAQCHTLARAVNSPVSSRGGWRAYITEMRLRSGADRAAALSREEANAVVSFLAFDGKLRKIDDRETFDAQTRKLQRRFWSTIEERLRRLQECAPKRSAN